jgi:pilus assembly protein Flp/PilA
LVPGTIPASEVTTPLAASCAVTTMLNLLRKLLREEDGPTAVEYAVMMALIVVACLGAVQSMANATADSFDESAAELASVMG